MSDSSVYIHTLKLLIRCGPDYTSAIGLECYNFKACLIPGSVIVITNKFNVHLSMNAIVCEKIHNCRLLLT